VALIACAKGQDRRGSAKEGILLGIFHEGSQKDLAPVNRIEESIGKKFASVMWYQDWTSPFPMAEARRVSRAGYMPHITWEPWSWENKDLVKLQDILDGKWDKYIEDWAKGAARFGRPILLRWGHEFNGDWYPWSVPNNGQDPSLYVRAYRRVHDAFRKAGADKVSWIWCFNANSVPAMPWNAPQAAYPGDQYVDWVGIDGYDFSGSESFHSIFKGAYAKAVASTAKPLMIAEFATGGAGPYKARWIAQMAAGLHALFPAVKAITWFDIEKERDWRLLSSIDSLNAARAAFGSEAFLSDPAWFGKVETAFPSLRQGHLDSLKVLAPKKQAQEAAAAAFPDADGLGGVKASWAGTSPIVLTSEKGQSDMEAEIRLGYSTRALFLRAVIRDDFPMNNDKAGADIWNGDCLEVCISTRPEADPEREFYGPGDFQVGLSPGKPDKGLGPSAWVWAALKKVPAGTELRAERSPSGYILEARIPWASLDPEFKPESGMALGFDLAVDDADSGSTDRERQTVWSGDQGFYANPSQWGILRLK
jgi:hypothetical protein